MKRKLGVIQAFQADPPVLILDEPTEGLDPIVQEAFYLLLADVKRRGRTVFMSSHVLSEIERVCDRVAVIRSGRLAIVAPVAEIKRLAGRRIHVTFSRPVSMDAAALPPGIEVAATGPTEWSLVARGEVGALLPRLGALPVADLRIDEARLEDVLIRFYREEVMMKRTLALVRHSWRRSRSLVLLVAALLCLFQVVMVLAAQTLQTTGTFAQLTGMIPPVLPGHRGARARIGHVLRRRHAGRVLPHRCGRRLGRTGDHALHGNSWRDCRWLQREGAAQLLGNHCRNPSRQPNQRGEHRQAADQPLAPAANLAARPLPRRAVLAPATGLESPTPQPGWRLLPPAHLVLPPPLGHSAEQSPGRFTNLRTLQQPCRPSVAGRPA